MDKAFGWGFAGLKVLNNQIDEERKMSFSTKLKGH